MDSNTLNKIIEGVNGSCLICADELSKDNATVCSDQENSWSIGPYCIDCCKHYQDVMWINYITNIINADCEKSLKRAVTYPAPEYLTFNAMITGSPIINYYHCGQIYSAKLNIPYNELKIKEINDDIEKLREKMLDDNFDYLSEIHFFVERHNLHKYKK